MAEPGTKPLPQEAKEPFTLLTYEFMFKCGKEWTITLVEGKDEVEDNGQGLITFRLLESDTTTEIDLTDTSRRTVWKSVVELTPRDLCRQCKRWALPGQGVCRMHGGVLGKNYAVA